VRALSSNFILTQFQPRMDGLQLLQVSNLPIARAANPQHICDWDFPPWNGRLQSSCTHSAAH